MSMSIFLLVLNTMVIFVVAAWIISVVHGLSQWLLAYLFKLDIKTLTFGLGPVIFMHKFLEFRVFPFWFKITVGSTRLQNIFLEMPYKPNYRQIMAPKRPRHYFFEQISYLKKNLFLLSGILGNCLLFFTIWFLMFCLSIDFQPSLFFASFFDKISYGFHFQMHPTFAYSNFAFRGHFTYQLLLLNCFFILINFFPVYYLDGYDIFITFYEKVSKKRTKLIVSETVGVIALGVLTWMTIGFLLALWS